MAEAAHPVVLTLTFPDEPTAAKVVDQLVEQRLVACAQLWPIRSVYRWKGAVQKDAEVIVQAKTVAARLNAIEKLIQLHHPYEVPEMLATPLAWGHGPYLDWMVKESRDEPLE